MGKITREDVMTYSKEQLVKKLSGKFDRISDKIRKFRALGEEAEQDYTNYVKQFIGDVYFNEKGTLNKGMAGLSKLPVNKLRKLMFKTLSVGESPTMRTTKTYTRAKTEQMDGIKATIQTQMEDLGISPDVINKFINDSEQVYIFNEMLKVSKTPYSSDILKTMVDYADGDKREHERNMKRMIKSYEKKQMDMREAALKNQRERLLNKIGKGDDTALDDLRDVLLELNDIRSSRGNDIR